MRPTKEFIERCIHEINQQCFNGELPMLPIELNSNSRRLGCMSCLRKRTGFRTYQYSDFKMTISTRYDFTEGQIRDTICHEMIHYYISWKQMNDTSAHGKLFRSIMNRLNKEFGYNMTITQRLTDTEIESAPRNKTYLVCVSHFADGRTGITISAKTRIFRLWDAIPKLSGISEVQWYLSHDPYWSKYRASLMPIAYLANPEEVQTHLKDAKRLIREGNKITTMRTINTI